MSNYLKIIFKNFDIIAVVDPNPGVQTGSEFELFYKSLPDLSFSQRLDTDQSCFLDPGSGLIRIHSPGIDRRAAAAHMNPRTNKSIQKVGEAAKFFFLVVRPLRPSPFPPS